jgi:hypothetical protein
MRSTKKSKTKNYEKQEHLGGAAQNAGGSHHGSPHRHHYDELHGARSLSRAYIELIQQRNIFNIVGKDRKHPFLRKPPNFRPWGLSFYSARGVCNFPTRGSPTPQAKICRKLRRD